MRIKVPVWDEDWSVGDQKTFFGRPMWIVALDAFERTVTFDDDPPERDPTAEHGRFRCDLAAIIGAVW